MKKLNATIRHGEYLVRKIVAATAAFILCLSAAKPFVRLALEIPHNGDVYLRQSIDKLKTDEYGNCSAIGYGYIKKITALIPDLNLFPVTRYPNYNLYPDVLFSDSRYRYDDRILVGIELDKDATREAVISRAAWESTDHNLSTWTFQTTFDYDLLTGFVFDMGDNLSSQSQHIEITLYDMPQHFVELGHWVILVPADQNVYTYRVEKPLGNFSFGRGATDFIIKVRSVESEANTVQLESIKILGVKVDLSNYRVFNEYYEDDRWCFAAIKESFFQEIQKGNIVEWKRYLEQSSNVDFNY